MLTARVFLDDDQDFNQPPFTYEARPADPAPGHRGPFIAHFQSHDTSWFNLRTSRIFF